MPQDQFFKELLQAFFREFLELFFPAVAARLDFARVTFLDKEAFTDWPQGARREADLVAQVYTLDGLPELILVHTEIQTQRRGEFPYRMFEYYALLRLRYKTPVFPVVVYLAPGAGGLVKETYAETIFEDPILTFVYNAVGLPDLDSDDYLARANPLAPAFSALMRPGGPGRALRKLMATRNRALLDADEARRTMLLDLIDRYLPLSESETVEFQELLGGPEMKEVETMITSYERRGIEMGLVRGKRETLLRLLRRKFGDLTPAVVERVESLNEEAELDARLDKILTASSLEEMDL